MSADRQDAKVIDNPSSGRQRRRRRIWAIVIVVIIAFLIAVCWVGLRAITVKDGLVESQALIAEIQDGGDVDAVLPDLSESAASAGAAASDPVWWVMEWIPVLGDNLKGVRLSAQSLDTLVNDVALPVMGDEDSTGSITERLLAATDDQAKNITELADGLDSVSKSPFLVSVVRDGVDKVDEVMGSAAPMIAALPTLLGGDGERNYLLVFQNNAETLALGGSAAAQTLVRVDAGSIAIGGQGDSGNYQNGVAVDVDVPQSAIDLYTSYLVDHINTSMSRPDFPTAAKIMRAWWQRDIADDEIAGVISIDPLALSRILKATGPIELSSGEMLSEDNAVSLLLSEVYGRWDSYKEPDLVDGFFADTAAAVFEAIAAGDFDLKDMMWAITESASQGSVLVWSDDSQVAEAIEGARISGVLPTVNSDTTTMGIYFNNTNGSKIDYFTETATSATATCEADTATFTATASLGLPLTQRQAEALPRYVQSMTFGARFRDTIYVYGPPGTTLSDATFNGDEVSIAHRDIDDLGRPVVAFEAWFDPGDSVDVTATFVGPSGDYGPLAVRTNPMVNGTKPVVTDDCAG
ncbi:hypothetical protein BMW26_13155 [Microbacterium sp. 1.5R]|uniref:DUF4012 domain-containing protein n=1 Tax=unclassified Microbacterium TaxID=2609290 RepID=UPI0006F3BDD2|nr:MULTISPECIES: DUF4012 domain-containing protein [unclassified Microbacterium]APH45796.1 hypothetical protein BMW26_13155 [Microbacterium sp. 1.5R]KRD50721.1 hypothetical protein ASE34_14450 [Microbacterium sp. Root280D1]MBC6495884.1 hypothetical protein [Microbacterium sp. 4-7]CAH0136053.1 hypothetical protein SRABI98_00420 [Microbacterium sp. Bi98]